MKRITRRTALAAIGTGGAGTCLCGLSGGCATFTKKGRTPPIAATAYTVRDGVLTVMLDQVPELAAAGGAVKVIDGRLPTPLIIARTGASRYVAVSLLCPHRSAEVEYQHAEQRFRCASLGHSAFGLDGARQRGPAKHGLIPCCVEQEGSCLSVAFGQKKPAGA